ncbi:unnamed protein product [Microthlaspi erraticum]|uniref:Uncharacterized protein n=1 Tax=Microthlaspi erraticum TaxID=1685480 RepID=A0A6D2JTQ3_9BRAS|nr:unnamed protein product [Microthlaspi erraticum]
MLERIDDTPYVFPSIGYNQRRRSKVTFSYNWSSSARKNGRYRGQSDGRIGIPRKCNYGWDIELLTSHVAQGRRSYVNKWWDEAMMEELDEVKGNLDDNDTSAYT